MKKLLFTLLAVIAVSSCKKNNSLTPSGESSNVTINLSVGETTTRAVSISRYIVEIYNATDMATRLHRVEQAGGTVVLPLDNSQNYTALIWADNVALNDNTNGVYNALELKNVTLNVGKTMEEAFFGKLSMAGTTTTYNLTLNRPMAQVNMIETSSLTANTDLVVTYDQYPSFNTNTSASIGTAVSTTHTFNSNLTTGTMGTFMSFASVGGIVTNFTSVYNTTTTNQILNVPLKANYITNIRGDFAKGEEDFTIIMAVNQTWESVIGGVHINVGTTATPQWIIVADRNAEKGSTNGATTGNTTTDYGYYYQWSNTANDPTNADKTYRACFDFAEGNGIWRLPTDAELNAISGNGGATHNVNSNRKMQWDGTTWKLYDERVGKTSDFVYFPLAGFLDGTTSNIGISGHYWSPLSDTWMTLVSDGDSNNASHVNNAGSQLSVRCVRNAN